MLRLSFFLLFFSMQALASFNYQGALGLGSFYQSNLFFQSENTESGMVTLIQPEVKLSYESKKTFTEFDLGVEHQMVSAFSEASRTEYDINLTSGFGDKQSSKNYIELIHGNRANPLFSATSSAGPIFSNSQAVLSLGLTINPKNSVDLKLIAETKTVDLDEFRYLNSAANLVELIYNYRFLPETVVYTKLYSGTRTYSEGRVFFDADNDDTRLKYDSDITGISTGINGRLTKYTSIDAGFGLKSMKYTESKSFAEPVFHVQFTDQISPKDALIAGYIYRAVDSSYTNWALEQDMNIAYSKIIRDTFLFLTRLSYVYYSYSEPFRREDQRLLAKFKVDYVFANNWTLISKFDIDLLVSDAFDSNTSSIDRPASYTNFDLGFQVKRSF